MSLQRHSQPQKLTVPEFHSEIPEFLLKSASPVEKHLLLLTSRIEKNMVWQNDAIAEVDFKQQETNGKVRVMYALYKTLTSRTVLILFLLMIMLGYPAYLSLGPEKLKQAAAKIFDIIF